MEAARKNSGEEQKKYSNELKAAQENIRSAARRLKEAKKMVQTHKEERDTLSAEQQQLLKEKTKLELIIKDLSDEVLGDNTSKVQIHFVSMYVYETTPQGYSLIKGIDLFRIQYL
jgi:hypothetical protein